MVITILITFISLIGLIILHEFGHFIMAKRFGVKVEEFGVGLPPRIFGKKFGETIFSLNLFPFGAFVKLYGEEEAKEDPRSFSAKPIWQRALIVVAGVVSFWIVSVILLSFVFWLGTPQAISDEENQKILNPKVQIVAIAPNSPAESVGLRPGDAILAFEIENKNFPVDKIKGVQEFTEKYKGDEVVLIIERGKETFEVKLIPRVSPPQGEGAMGVALARTSFTRYPWYQAPFQGIVGTFNFTLLVVQGWVQVLLSTVRGVSTGVQLVGPVGIFGLVSQQIQLGINYFLQFIALISIYLALFNILPIPALDGGKLFFLAAEKIRGKAIPQKIEQRITAFFFALLLALIVFITFKDIQKLF